MNLDLFVSKINYNNDKCKSFFEDMLFVGSLGGKQYSVVGDTKMARYNAAFTGEQKSDCLRDVIRVVVLAILLPLTLIALAFRQFNRSEMTIVGDVAPSEGEPILPDVDPSIARVISSAVAMSTDPNYAFVLTEILTGPESYREGREPTLGELKAREIHEIIPGLFLGGSFRNIVRYDGSKPAVGRGPITFGAIVRVSPRDDDFGNTNTAMPENEIRLDGSGDNTKSIGIEDFTFENVKNATLHVLTNLLAREPVLINCKQGCDRSPAITSMILAILFNLTQEKAAAFVKFKRVIACPYLRAYDAKCEELLPTLKADPEIRNLAAQIHGRYSRG